MTNNDILRRLRYAFKLSDSQAVALFSQDPASHVTMNEEGYLDRLAKDDDDRFKPLSDIELAAFLDGLIVSKRGLRDPVPEYRPKPKDYRLSKNDILKKLRIALSFREEQMLAALAAGGSKLSKGELGALFRNPGHKHYRSCGNQVLRNFIKGLTVK